MARSGSISAPGLARSWSLTAPGRAAARPHTDEHLYLEDEWAGQVP